MAELVPLRVLYVEDWAEDAALVTIALKRGGYDVQPCRVTTPSEMQAALQERACDIVIADHSLPNFNAAQALTVLRQSGLDLPFIIVSGTMNEAEAVAALRSGAHDFITKGNLGRLVPAIERELRVAENRRQARQAQDLLREQESSFQLLFEHNPLPMWVYDVETLAFLEVNHSAIAHYGYSRDEFLALKITDIRPQEDIPALLVNVQSRQLDFRPVEHYWRHRLKSGVIIHVEIASHAMPFRGRAAVLIVAYDITKRKSAEAALAASEKRFRSLIENSSDAIALLGADGYLQYVSPSTSRILGYAPDEMLGADPARFTHPDDLPALLSLLQSVIQQPAATVTTTYRFQHRDGSWRWLEASICNMLADASVAAIVFNYRDITDRLQSAAALQASEAELRALFAAMTDVIFVVDADGRYLTVAPTSPGSFYAPPAEVLGKTAHELFIEAQADEFVGYIRRALATGEPVHYEYSLPIHGETMWFDATVSPVGADAVFFIARDITRRKQAELLRQVLLEIAQGLAHTNELPEFLGLVHRALAKVIYVENFFVVLYNDQTGLFEEAYSVDQFDLPAEPSRLEKSISAYVFRTGQPLLLTQARFDQLAAQGEVELIGTNSPSWLGVPLKTSSRTIGVMVIQDYHQTGRYSERDIEYLASVAGQAALVVERKQAEAAVAASERRFRALIENSADAITLLAPDGTVVYDSPSAPGLLGYGPTELYGTNVFELFHPDDLAPNKLLLAEVLQKPDARLRSTFRLRHKEGHWRWIEALASNLLDEPSVSAIVVNYRDITERRHAEAQIQQQVERLAALRAIDMAISTSQDLKPTLAVLLDQVIQQLGVHAADILLADVEGNTFTYTAGRGFRSSYSQQAQVRLGEGRAGRAALERRIVGETKYNSALFPSPRTGLLWRDGFVSYYAVPLIAKGQVLGILEIFHRTPLQPDREWLHFLEALASQAAIAVDNAMLFGHLQHSHHDLVSAYDATIAGWSAALDLRDKETKGHSQRVTDLTLRLAEGLNIPEAELIHVRRGALLHDIGKMGIPDSILLKPGPLSDDEWEIMRRHPKYAYEMLSPIAYLRPALEIPYCHHEKWDGTGYPRGLRGAQIPLAARVFAVVDVWDALSSDRPYRPAWAAERVMAHIRSLAGSHFDPRAVEAFLKVGGQG